MFGLLLVREGFGPVYRWNIANHGSVNGYGPGGIQHLGHWLSNGQAARRDLALWRRNEKRRQLARNRL